LCFCWVGSRPRPPYIGWPLVRRRHDLGLGGVWGLNVRDIGLRQFPSGQRRAQASAAGTIVGRCTACRNLRVIIATCQANSGETALPTEGNSAMMKCQPPAEGRELISHPGTTITRPRARNTPDRARPAGRTLAARGRGGGSQNEEAPPTRHSSAEVGNRR